MYIDIRFASIELEAQATRNHASASITVRGLLSAYVAADKPTRGAPWVSAGWNEGIKGAFEVRLGFLYVSVEVIPVRRRHLRMSLASR